MGRAVINRKAEQRKAESGQLKGSPLFRVEWSQAQQTHLVLAAKLPLPAGEGDGFEPVRSLARFSPLLFHSKQRRTN
jgi:hypothetical protein